LVIGWSSWWHFWRFGGEECYGASDGTLSLSIYLLLCIGSISAGSATRNCNQKCTRQDLKDKCQEMENKNKKLFRSGFADVNYWHSLRL
jgi:hypothetical protein